MVDFLSVQHKLPTVAQGLAVLPRALSDLRGVSSVNFMGPIDVEAPAQGIVDAIGN
jgi:hypothetical protein